MDLVLSPCRSVVPALRLVLECGGSVAFSDFTANPAVGLAAYFIAPGNMHGGMSSISEKSLGCTFTTGRAPRSGYPASP
ncbi:MAG TPA: UxaA family hydrolase [Spirochaetota bacterium]|nr:UxaA family hydrolase [Spirochaetota bacterium]HOD16055.1 UxaA family hydrolase [Spirochaetota bacterium]HPG51896.1 UxaA family hydrolase [Spirochaetota bacterium]HPN14412.1 UxaA family hydrolase [Spirochaetota bacterium]HQL84092.1 UxaA family hydrolase [Spirochaetota bacterium]